ncbi:molybdate ABC transporter permease subunit [Endozoicomonas sp. SM1973]|uniref:Molybdenum transport system permease n=1 Tax=Spartinivicinus marinus TaxID=2994442 RepID=A0A853I6J8_9GAMM|nr:molybdate ABC transporter permease subunit [Spartinivicinus marinus]MCX4026383.1 molybdate ABC transporter permease subunit [Spartinivicinus marinus]NYZ67272.1 molybdate ABC transporter permease subunit [Spartinivicinus marinus]
MDVLTEQDWLAIKLTLQLALVTTIILLLIGPVIAWWLAHGRSRVRNMIEALVAMPLILPPTVLGFYLLIAFSPNSFIGNFWLQLTGSSLTFTFQGLVIGSVLYSLPFMVQPLQAAFNQLDIKLLQAASSMGANRWDQFFNLIIPLTKRSFLIATSMAFAHTVGEFGVVLMIGGNIPGETQVLSIALFDHVESLNYQQAHWLAGILLVFSFLLLWLLYSLQRNNQAANSPTAHAKL